MALIEDDIEKLVLDAQNDRRKMNLLIKKFLPFIRKCVTVCRARRQSREDAMTLAMLAFADSVATYKADKGAFLSFAKTVIRNRLIDDFRTEQRHSSRIVPMLAEHAECEEAADWEMKLSIREHDRRLERASLRLEIEEMSAMLSAWNTSFAELAKLCPKRKRTRGQCQYIAALILKNEAWRKSLLEKRRMPTKEMCENYGVSAKIFEKYRKYIATLCIIQIGDYPGLQSFLPVDKKDEIIDE